MKRLLILSFAFILIQPIWACQCADTFDYESVFESNYSDADLIFTAKGICVNEDGSYDLEIIEPIKGKWGGKIISGGYFNSCSKIPDPKEDMWLIYATVREGNKININECGLSRSISFPKPLVIRGMTAPLMAGDFENDMLSRVERRIVFEQYSIKSLELLQKEITELRKRRDN